VWFGKDCSKLLDQRKQAKLQTLQNPSQINRDNLNNVRQTIKHFSNKKREYMKDRINELETHSKNNNIRDLYRAINEFKKGYQPITNLVKDEDGNLLADSHYFECMEQLLLSPIIKCTMLNQPKYIQLSHWYESRSFQVEIVIEKLCKSPGIDEVPAELIQAGGKTLCSDIHKLINYDWNKD
jgi:hypothetical protein